MPSKNVPALRAQVQQHKQNQTTIILLVVGVLLLGLAVASFIYLPQAQQQVAQQQQQGGPLVPVAASGPAKDIALTDLNGKPVKFSDYKGQVILYNAWATWCPPCKEEMPVLNAYYNDHKADGFVVLAVEDGEPLAEVANYVKSTGLNFPVWPDPQYLASDGYGIKNLPTTYVIGRDFTLRLTWTGAVTRDTLERYVTPLLQEQANQ